MVYFSSNQSMLFVCLRFYRCIFCCNCSFTRLEESKNRNLKLRDEFRLVMRECESLKQRYEEESLAKAGDR